MDPLEGIQLQCDVQLFEYMAKTIIAALKKRTFNYQFKENCDMYSRLERTADIVRDALPRYYRDLKQKRTSEEEGGGK